MSAPVTHTPGPWLMAAKPSSIVGWPVVAPAAMGRVICNINYADKAALGGPQPGDRAFNAESKANARLIAASPELLLSAQESLDLVNDLLAGIGISDDRLRDVGGQLARAIAKAEDRL